MSSLAVQPSLAKLSFSKIFSFSSFSVLLLLHDQMSLSKHLPLLTTPSFFSFTDQMISFSKSFPTPQKNPPPHVFLSPFFPSTNMLSFFSITVLCLQKKKTFSILSFSIILMLFSSPQQKSKKSGSKSRISSLTDLSW